MYVCMRVCMCMCACVAPVFTMSWSDYCGSSAPYLTSHDLTPCMQTSTVMLIPPCLLLLTTTHTCMHMYRTPRSPYTITLMTPRILLICTILLLHVIMLLQHIITSQHDMYMYVWIGVSTCAWSVCLAILCMASQRQLTVPKMVRMRCDVMLMLM